MVSLCAGAFVLGQAGVLDGRRVTTHWALADEFRAAFPRAHLVEHAMYVDDGQMLSSGGMLASADLCLYVLRPGPRSVVRQRRVPGADQPAAPHGRPGAVREGAPPPPTGSLAPVLEWLDEHLAEPLTLARRRRAGPHERADAGTAVPGRDRREPRRLDCPPAVERARALLEDSDLTVSAGRPRRGFRLDRGDAAALPRAHRHEPAVLPGHLPPSRTPLPRLSQARGRG